MDSLFRPQRGSPPEGGVNDENTTSRLWQSLGPGWKRPEGKLAIDIEIAILEVMHLYKDLVRPQHSPAPFFFNLFCSPRRSSGWGKEKKSLTKLFSTSILLPESDHFLPSIEPAQSHLKYGSVESSSTKNLRLISLSPRPLKKKLLSMRLAHDLDP